MDQHHSTGHEVVSTIRPQGVYYKVFIPVLKYVCATQCVCLYSTVCACTLQCVLVLHGVCLYSTVCLYYTVCACTTQCVLVLHSMHGLYYALFTCTQKRDN